MTTSVNTKARPPARLENQDSMRSYLTAIGKVKLLTASEEVALAKAVQAAMKEDATLTEKAQGQKAKDEMTRANLRLVVTISKKYQKRG